MMILRDVTKVYDIKNRKQRPLLRQVNLAIPSDRRIALLGRSEPDKRHLIDLLAGVGLPTAGKIIRRSRVSFPIGHLGGLSKELSVRRNVIHVAKIYGANAKQIADFVAAMLDFSPFYERPLREFPREDLRLLGAIMALSIPFDFYLLPDDVLRNEKVIGKKCHALFRARMQTAGILVSTRSPSFAEQHCDMGLVIHEGELTLFETVEEAFAHVMITKETPRL